MTPPARRWYIAATAALVLVLAAVVGFAVPSLMAGTRLEEGRAEHTAGPVDPVEEELPKESWCKCAPGDLLCAMDCAAIRSRPAMAPLDRPLIRRVVAQFTPSVKRDCWEAALDGGPFAAPEARVEVQLTIAPSGLVENASTSNDPKAYPGLARCIERHVRRWKFPKSSATASADVPFVFTRAVLRHDVIH